MNATNRAQLLFLGTVCLGTVVSLGAAQAGPGKWETHYYERIKAFEAENAQLPKGKTHVVLLGSSTTEGWKYKKRVERFLPELKDRVLNRGITADPIGRGKRGIFNRLESSVFKTNPSHVFLLNGRNDMGKSAKPPVEKTAAVYRKVIEAIKARHPKAIVCVVTCAPVNKSYTVMDPHLRRYNGLITQIAKSLGCPVIDFHKLIAGPDGLLPLKLTKDGLHFNDGGYEVLAREIQRVVREFHPGKRKRKR
jgi:lysophospholipase L1-like esterase